ncbi:MAG: beta-glucosidase BglX [Ignavibacteriaceae bacterium]
MNSPSDTEKNIADLLNRMTLKEKIGQLCVVHNFHGNPVEVLRENIVGGEIGAVLNEVNVDIVNELQHIAVKESRLGIPLMIGRDVIHGFKTIFPISLGQAASWNPELIRDCARKSAVEAAAAGINWTFAPMLDICRDPRWGRVAETLGEDPFLTAKLGVAMVEGFQGDDLSRPDSIAACAKHFAGYGASESGRDYNTTNIPEIELRSTHLPPFKAVVDAGVATFMTSFSDLNGVPASANGFLLKDVLRKEWDFDGFIASDWESIAELITHGLVANSKEAAFEAANAGLDMEMASNFYSKHIEELISENRLSIEQIDEMVANVLRIKFRLGLFNNPFTNPGDFPAVANPEHLNLAKEAAIQSVVLLKNGNKTLPLSVDRIASVAVIGPLADDAYEQLGTWIFDGDPQYSQTPLRAITEFIGESAEVRYVRAMETTRSKTNNYFNEAVEAARNSDISILFLGEESILTGEAHCRADIRLPGNQEELINEISSAGKPVVLVVMAGRPIALENVIDKIDALLYVWHPGTMGGPAISDILFGKRSPSGKLPVTFPRVTGQIPVYYSHKNTGRPATELTFHHIDDIVQGSEQTSLGNTSFHLDVKYTPLFPFGFGLSYSEFQYSNIKIDRSKIALGESLTVSAELSNTGSCEAEEIAQLYIRDLVGNVTRPVKELKGFRKIKLLPGERTTVSFEIHTDDLAYFNRKLEFKTDTGKFHVWIGGNSDTGLHSEFEII